MPSANEIHNGLATIANSWQPLSIAWHVYFGALTAALLFGWQASERLVAGLLIPSVISVSVMAWIGDNPFNGAVFVLLAAALVTGVRGLSGAPVKFAAGPRLVLGALLFGFGWIYPHFLEAESVWSYLYAAPLGLVPCPTLTIVAAMTLLCRISGSLTWSLAVIVAGIFYGVFGSLYLGVTIDWVLTGGALIVLVFLLRQAITNNASAG